MYLRRHDPADVELPDAVLDSFQVDPQEFAAELPAPPLLRLDNEPDLEAFRSDPERPLRDICDPVDRTARRSQARRIEEAGA